MAVAMMRWVAMIVVMGVAAGCGGHSASGASGGSCSSSQRASSLRAVRSADMVMTGAAVNYTVAGAMSSPATARLKRAADAAIRREIATVKRVEPCIGAARARAQLAADAKLWRQYPAFAALYRGALAGL